MIITLKSVKKREFESDGEMVTYFWYKALFKEDGVTREVGCKRGDLPLGVEHEEPNLEKYEKSNGKIGYRIVDEA